MVSFDFAVVLVPFIGLGAVFYASYIRPFVKIHGNGRTVSSLNSDNCTAVKGLAGCEDMYLDRESGVIYLACLAPSLRRHWEPALLLFNETAMPAVAPGYFATYDARTGIQTILTVDGLDDGILPHGFDLFVHAAKEEGGPRQATVFAINHRKPHNLLRSAASTGADSVVEIFETTIGSSTMRHVKTVSHSAIVTPNSVLAVSPTAFYVSNDHYRKTGLQRRINTEAWFGWPASSIAYCDLRNTWSTCSIAHDETLFPNGLARGPEETIYAASSLNGGISHLAMAEDGELALLKTIEVPRMLDNIHVEPDGAIFAVAIPIVDQFKRALDGKGTCATEVWRITNETGSSAYYGGQDRVEKIFADDGSRVSAITGALPFEGKLYLTGLPADHLTICGIGDV